MKLNIVRKRDVPEPPYTGILICQSVDSIPYMLYAIWLHSQKYWFTDSDNARRGRRMLYENGANMLTDCGGQIVEAIQQVYRLIDSNENGTVYTSSGDGTPDDPFVISPQIPTVPLVSAFAAPGSRHDRSIIRDGIRNLLNGEQTFDFPDPRNVRVQLDEIKALLQAMGGSDEDIEALLNLILLALG